MDFLVTAEWLDSQLKDDCIETVVVDCRFQLTDSAAGKQSYLNGHIPGAVYLDLNKDLSDDKQEHGGNHPLPEEEKFADTVGRIGIDAETTVVVYDQANDMFASRCWWLLRYYGHEKVFMLNGGITTWIKQGYPLSREIPEPVSKQFIPHINKEEVVNIEQVKQKLKQDSAVLIDSRESQRYLGKTEPLYNKAGHIPGAENFFWKDVLTEEGKWKEPQELQEHFSPLPNQKEIIVSCGSGVSACSNIAALKTAGFQQVKLYPGSFSDWISYPENPVATGKD